MGVLVVAVVQIFSGGDWLVGGGNFFFFGMGVALSIWVCGYVIRWLFWFVPIWVWVCSCSDWVVGGGWVFCFGFVVLVLFVNCGAMVVWWLLVVSMVGLIWVWLVGSGGAEFGFRWWEWMRKGETERKREERWKRRDKLVFILFYLIVYIILLGCI